MDGAERPTRSSKVSFRDPSGIDMRLAAVSARVEIRKVGALHRRSLGTHLALHRESPALDLKVRSRRPRRWPTQTRRLEKGVTNANGSDTNFPRYGSQAPAGARRRGGPGRV